MKTYHHKWKIQAMTEATEDLYATCLDVPEKISDVEIDQIFFVQEDSWETLLSLFSGWRQRCLIAVWLSCGYETNQEKHSFNFLRYHRTMSKTRENSCPDHKQIFEPDSYGAGN